MEVFQKIDGVELEQVLSEEKRQYLVGNLKLPQKLEHIQNEDIEVGISDYPKEFEDAPYYHTQQREFMYLLSGETIYKDIETGEEHFYKKGDFFFIDKNTKYSQKIEPGTRIFFIKYPAVNDKVVVKGEEQ